MRLRGSKILTSRPVAHGSGFCQLTHRHGLPVSEKESHYPSLGDFSPRENEERNLIAPVAVTLLRTRSFSTNTPLSRIDADRKSTRLNSSHRCISYAVF